MNIQGSLSPWSQGENYVIRGLVLAGSWGFAGTLEQICYVDIPKEKKTKQKNQQKTKPNNSNLKLKKKIQTDTKAVQLIAEEKWKHFERTLNLLLHTFTTGFGSDYKHCINKDE